MAIVFGMGLWTIACSKGTPPVFPEQDQGEGIADAAQEVAEPPVVTIKKPSSNAVLEGVVDCVVDVTDPVGGRVKSVAVGLFDLHTKQPTTIVTAKSTGNGEYTASLDTAKTEKGPLPDGNFALVALVKMRDNRKGQASLIVKVDNLPPSIAVARPRPGGNFMGNLTMVLAVTDHGGTGVRYVKLLMDGTVLDSVISTKDKPIKDMKPIVFQHSSKSWTPGKLTFTLEAADNVGHKTTKTLDVNYVEQPFFLTGKYVDQGDFQVDRMCVASGPSGDRIITVGKGGLIYWTWSDRAQSLVPFQVVSQTGSLLECGDINHDGIDDIVVGKTDNKQTKFMSYLGNKEGGYTYKSTLTIGTNVSSFTLGDLSGDGAPELVGISPNTNKAVILAQNDGSGKFGKVSTYGGVSDAGHVIVADLTGDGINDVLVSRTRGGLFTLFSGNGDGTVSIGLNSTVPIDTVNSLVGGKLEPGVKEDRAMAVDSAKAKLYMISQKGSASNYSLGISDTLSTALGPAHVAFGDINKDTYVDLAAICTESNLVAIFFGTSDGHFQAVHWYEAGGGRPDQVVMADVNRDGFKDIVVLNKALGRFTILMFEKALYTPGDITTAAFHGPQQIFLKGKLKDLAVGHFHQKDQYDAAVLSTITKDNGEIRDSILVYQGQNGVFQQEPVVAEEFVEKHNGFVTADLDKNDLDDFVVTGSSPNPDNSLKLVFSKAHGYSSSAVKGFVAPIMVGVGDMGSLTGTRLQDGYPDLAVISQNPKDQEQNRVSILLNTGTGTFQMPQGAVYPLDKSTVPTDIMLAKLSSPDFPDLFIASASDITYFPTSGLGGNYDETNQKRLAMGNGLTSLFLGYLGGADDSSPDLLALAIKDKAIAISYDLGQSHLFNPPVSLKYPGPAPVTMTVDDLNLDKYPDIIVLDTQESTVNVFMNLGSSQFSAPYSFPVGSGPVAMAIKDINSDGCNDILTLDGKGETVTVLLNLLCQEKSSSK